MKAWSHLPNAAHIDQVLVDLNNHPSIFVDVIWNESRNSARDAIRDAIRGAARHAEWNSLWPVTGRAGGRAGGSAARPWSAARYAIAAFIAYDNAGEYMTMPPDQALVWGKLRGDHAYALLREYLHIRQQMLVDIN
jgi:hypothetical protein